jgi:hypothetical protein
MTSCCQQAYSWKQFWPTSLQTWKFLILCCENIYRIFWSKKVICSLHITFYASMIDRLCSLVVRVPGYTTEMYCDSCEVRTEFIYVMYKKVDCLCGLVVRVPGYTTEMYCSSCEVRTQFIYVMYKKVDRLWLQIQSFRVRFPALPDFLCSRRSGTGSTQPREYNWGATWKK